MSGTYHRYSLFVKGNETTEVRALPEEMKDGTCFEMLMGVFFLM